MNESRDSHPAVSPGSSANPGHRTSGGSYSGTTGPTRVTSRNDSSQKGIFFLISRKVTIAYGPYMSLGILDYRTERLEGLMKALKKVGGEPILQPSYHVNMVRIWHLEHEIFRCAITDLQHGGDGDMDRLCLEAAKALDKSARKAYYNLKCRYKLQLNLNAGCPCHSDQESNHTLESIGNHRLSHPESHPHPHHPHHGHGHGDHHHQHHTHGHSSLKSSSIGTSLGVNDYPFKKHQSINNSHRHQGSDLHNRRDHGSEGKNQQGMVTVSHQFYNSIGKQLPNGQNHSFSRTRHGSDPSKTSHF